jgi:hypothetical protein
MFKGRSIARHLLRGAVGFGFLALALLYAPIFGLWTVVLGAGALVCFRGCPMCWILGFVETVFD